MKTDCYIEFNGTKTASRSLVDEVKELWKNAGNKIKDIHSLSVYFKPEEQTCYYVVNGSITGKFPVQAQ